MQVPTGKLALPERQVGRSHGTCWQGYFGKRHAVCGVWQGERGNNAVRAGMVVEAR